MKSLILGLFVLTFSNLWSQSRKPLLLPPDLSGDTIRLNMQPGRTLLRANDSSDTYGFNGSILGPTLRLQKGQLVQMEVYNGLSDSTTLHWHGFNVAAHNDGGPHTVIPQNSTWRPQFPILDHAGTYWYHPHLHHKTQEQVDKGLAGLIIVEDSLEASLPLPRTYGVDDWPLVLQTKDLDAQGQIHSPSHADSVAMVNATLDPKVDLPAQIVRLRVLNGSAMRSFRLGLDNGDDFYVLASDGGLLDSIAPVNRLEMAPGERYEILLDLTGMSGQSLNLMSYASELANGVYGASQPGRSSILNLNNYGGNPLNGSDFELLRIDVSAATANAVLQLPSTNLRSINRMDPNDAHATRSFIFSTQWSGPNQLNGPFLINNKSFDMSRIDETVPLNSLEVWELSNFSPMAHPFHVHKVQFQIIERSGQTDLAPIEKGYKDVVMVYPMETVKIIARYDTYANDTLPYMYHCHMLKHEDDGMMGQFVISTTPVSSDEEETKAWSLYPNPAHTQLKVKAPEPVKGSPWQIISLSGQVLRSGKWSAEREQRIDLSGLEAGTYLFQMKGECLSFSIVNPKF